MVLLQTLDNTERAKDIASKVEAFVRDIIIPYEADERTGAHGPEDSLIAEMREKARSAGVMTPHILEDGTHLTHRETALVLQKTGISPLGMYACATGAPDEGNMYLLGKVGSQDIKKKFLEPLVTGHARSAFFMTEPASDGGAGSDPSMMKTTARLDGNEWVINGRKAFITGVVGASIGIIMAKSEDGACMFLVDLPNPAIKIERVLNTIDNSMPGGHAVVNIENLRLPPSNMLGKSGEGFKYAQIRLAPARLTHCMRWLGLTKRAHSIAVDYATNREAFGKLIIDHEGVGFKLAQNEIDLMKCELLIDWCAQHLDAGHPSTVESSVAKADIGEMLFTITDRCIQVMGGTGITSDTIVAQAFREVRAFRIYDGPTEVHLWSLAKKIKKANLAK